MIEGGLLETQKAGKKLKDSKNLINPLLGLCFNPGAYDEELINDINSGKEVEVKNIPFNAKNYVKIVKPKTKKGAK